jgi:hypothetical protein
LGSQSAPINSRKSAKVTAAHFDALAEGLQQDTPEYFQHVERQIGLGGNSRRPGSERGAVQRTADYDPSKPSTHVRNGGKDVFLTKGERERATDGTLVWNYGPNKGKPLGIQEFARRKAEMVREGRFDRLE